ncbi:MAG: hypothetical protein K2G73_02450 [Eubacterium sp.]|nr:hypothetical protein [Eubacterium sp.]
MNTAYTYDANGLRVSKTVNGVKTYYQYSGDKLLYQEAGNQKLFFWYDAFGDLSKIYFVNGSSAAAYFVTCNSRGDVEALYNASGSLAAKYVYDSWGNTISVTDANGKAITSKNHIGNVNPIRYRGYYFDSETGFYYLQSRYYNPTVGRFLNADVYCDTGTSLLGTNMFAYCENNPIMYKDNDGLELTWAAVFDIIAVSITIDALFPCFRMSSNLSIGYIKNKDIPPESSGYRAPKGGDKRVPVPGNKSGARGWLDDKGNVWTPDKLHKDHWDVIPKNGKGHRNVYPDGHERSNESSISLGDFSFGVFENPGVVICIAFFIIIIIAIIVICKDFLPAFAVAAV